MADVEAGSCGICCTDGGGCISDSANPDNCFCWCEPVSGIAASCALAAGTPARSGDGDFALATLVDVRLNDLPTVDVVGGGLPIGLLEQISIPAAIARHRVTREYARTALADVFRTLGLQLPG